MKRMLFIAMALTVMALQAATPSDIVEQLRQCIASDKRTAVWEVAVVNQNNEPTLTGTVGTIEQSEAIEQALREGGVTRFVNHLTVLERTMPDTQRWAWVKLSVASLRCQGKHSAEMATQALMGMPLKVLSREGEWLRVQTPDDYISYVPESSVTFATADQMAAWRHTRRMVVTVYDARLSVEPDGEATVSDLVLGDILEFRGEVKGKWVRLATPDGRVGYVQQTAVADLDKWSKQDFDAKRVLGIAQRMMGSGYLWGGTSTKVTDCSGLVKISYLACGLILQRDASQQALTGLKIDDWHQARPADLLFFGNAKTGRVTHVGMLLEGDRYIHCSGQVKINSLEPTSPDYLYSPLSISRIDGQVGTRGIIALRDHPWYY